MNTMKTHFQQPKSVSALGKIQHASFNSIQIWQRAWKPTWFSGNANPPEFRGYHDHTLFK